MFSYLKVCDNYLSLCDLIFYFFIVKLFQIIIQLFIGTHHSNCRILWIWSRCHFVCFVCRQNGVKVVSVQVWWRRGNFVVLNTLWVKLIESFSDDFLDCTLCAQSCLDFQCSLKWHKIFHCLSIYNHGFVICITWLDHKIYLASPNAFFFMYTM